MPDLGNRVAEWFGHRTYPRVADAPNVRSDQGQQRCPFLSGALARETRCIKAPTSLGVCTISSTSNGTRQDWLACPYRVVESSLIGDVVLHLFGLPPEQNRLLIAAPRLVDPEVRSALRSVLEGGGTVVIYLQDKLGGEISLARTDRSPEMAFDATLVELSAPTGQVEIARFGILEVQTMDFHGSYRSVVKNLQDALRLHGENFAETLQNHPQWLSERIEGPNISNVFKRTFYQLMLKFRASTLPSCAGTVLALPEAVWESWQRHLGRPDLELQADGSWILRSPEESRDVASTAWIYVFDIDSTVASSPSPIVIKKRIATDPDSLAHFALKVAPREAFLHGGSVDRVPASIKRRLVLWWPEIWQLRFVDGV